jgi:hypothetical protein
MGFMQRCFCLSILCTTISADECFPRPFLFSQAIYSAMGVHDCGWWLGRDIATVAWWAIVLYYAWQEWKSRETVSLSFWLWLVAGLVAGLFWEVVWLVAALIVVCINSFPWKSYRIEPTAPPESQVMPSAPPANQFMPSAPSERQVMPSAPSDNQIIVPTLWQQPTSSPPAVPLPQGQAVDWVSRHEIYPSAVVVPSVPSIRVVARAPGMDVAAVSIDLPIRKATGWKRV